MKIVTCVIKEDKKGIILRNYWISEIPAIRIIISANVTFKV